MGFLPLPGLYHPVFYALAIDRVRVVGDPVALVIAATRYVAEDAAGLVVVDYDELTPVATMDARARPARVRALWPGRAATCCIEERRRLRRRRRRVRGRRPVVSERFVQHRYSNQPMETRGCVAEVDPVAGTVAVPRGHAEQPRVEVVAGAVHRSPTGLAVAGRHGRDQRDAYGRASRRKARAFAQANTSDSRCRPSTVDRTRRWRRPSSGSRAASRTSPAWCSGCSPRIRRRCRASPPRTSAAPSA